MAKPEIVEAGDYKFSVINGNLHRWPKEGSAAFGTTEEVPYEELWELPQKVKDILPPDKFEIRCSRR